MMDTNSSIREGLGQGGEERMKDGGRGEGGNKSDAVGIADAAHGNGPESTGDCRGSTASGVSSDSAVDATHGRTTAGVR